MNKRIEAFIGLLVKCGETRKSYELGEGSSRDAFALGDLVIKVPKNLFGDDPCRDTDEGVAVEGKQINRLGILQTEKEIAVWSTSSLLEKKILAKVYCSGYFEGVPYIVMERITVAENISIYDLEDDEDLEEMAKLQGWKLFPQHRRAIDSLVSKHKLAKHDLFCNSGNFGITKDREVVLCDFGFTGWGALC